MNGNRQIEVHYINTGFPYTITESFMDLFEGLSYTQADMLIAEALQDQGTSYWPMVHANLYKYGFSGSIGNSYYNFSQLYELNDYAPRLDGGRRVWENPLPSSNAELPQVVPDGSGGAEITANTNTDDRVRANNNTSNPQRATENQANRLKLEPTISSNKSSSSLRVKLQPTSSLSSSSKLSSSWLYLEIDLARLHPYCESIPALHQNLSTISI